MPIPGTDLSRCRCGAAFKYIGYGKRLCPDCAIRAKQRRANTAAMPKCRCGNVSRNRLCSRCEENDRQKARLRALNRLADRLIDRGF